MRLVVISTGWNFRPYIDRYVASLKSQTHTDFFVYLVDDGSTDGSYEATIRAVDGDPRFHVFRNETNLWKTANFVRIIRDRELVSDQDVLVEIDADDSLNDSRVLEDINRIYQDPNIWMCGSRWICTLGTSGVFPKTTPEIARSYWVFSHMRTYKAFLFRAIRDDDLRMNGEYFRAACDQGITTPMLEMTGSEHYYDLDRITYLYTVHRNMSGHPGASHGSVTLQRQTSKYIQSLPRYKKIRGI